MKSASASLALALIVAVLSVYTPDVSSASPGATPIPHPSQTPPPDIAAPSRTPTPLVINGQVIDLERGFIVFSSGDVFRLASDVVIRDDGADAPPRYPLDPGIFAVALLNPSTAEVTDVRTSLRPLARGTPAAQIPRQYVVANSAPRPNPDLEPRHTMYQNRLSHATLVTVTVEVPPETPFNDDIYMATDTSGWNPRAIRMQRVDGRHFRIQANLSAGIEFRYLFTRGSWQSVERDRAGLQQKARTLIAGGGDVQIINATVFRWADLP